MSRNLRKLLGKTTWYKGRMSTEMTPSTGSRRLRRELQRRNHRKRSHKQACL